MTQTLSGTFFNFSTPNTLTTNLPIPATAPTDSPIFVGKYRLNRDTVLVEGTVPFRFLIQHLDSTSMILSATFNQQAFQFDLSRG